MWFDDVIKIGSASVPAATNSPAITIVCPGSKVTVVPGSIVKTDPSEISAKPFTLYTLFAVQVPLNAPFTSITVAEESVTASRIKFPEIKTDGTEML